MHPHEQPSSNTEQTPNWRETDQDWHRKWREEENRAIEAAKSELAQEFDLERNARFDRAWEIAWSLGHVGGISEVKNYFCELVDLLKP